MTKKISPLFAAVALTAIAAIESARILSYAPFFLVYGSLAIVASIYYRNIYGSRLRIAPLRCLGLSLIGVIAGIFYASAFIGLIGAFLRYNGGIRGLDWDIIYIYRFICQGIDISPFIKNTILFLFIVVWAGVVEELFYRGALFGYLRGLGYGKPNHGLLASLNRSFIPAAIVSSLFFGLRHSLQLLYISPYPWGAGVIYFFFSFTAGMLLSGLYERSKSLTVCIITHTTLNFLGFPFLLRYLQN